MLNWDSKLRCSEVRSNGWIGAPSSPTRFVAREPDECCEPTRENLARLKRDVQYEAKETP